MTLIAPPKSLSSKYLVSRCFGTPKSLLRRCLGVQTPIVNRYDDRKSTDLGVRKPLPRFRLRNLVEKDCLERNCASCNYHHQEHEGQDHPIWPHEKPSGFFAFDALKCPHTLMKHCRKKTSTDSQPRMTVTIKDYETFFSLVGGSL